MNKGNHSNTSVLSEDEIKQKRELSKRRMQTLQHHVFVCQGGCCKNKTSSDDVLKAFKEAVEDFEATDFVRVTPTGGCLGRCGDACSVVVYPEGIWYKHVTPETAKEIVNVHFMDEKKHTDHVSYTYHDGKFIEHV